MAEAPIKVDADGIPILEEVIDPDAPEEIQVEADPLELPDDRVLDQLSDDPAIAELLDDIAGDLQNLVNWRIEEILKEEIKQVIREAAQRAAPQLAESIRAQLRLALPALLAEAFNRRRG